MMQFKRVYLGAALAIAACGILFQNCSEAPPPDQGATSSSSVYKAPGSYTCSFAGRTLLDGESVIAYAADAVAAGATCQTETRTCRNGALSGSYGFAVCQPAGALSCSFYGQTIANGGTVNAFLASSVPSGSTCTQQTRTCSNGTLSGTYQYSSCFVDCTFNGAVVANGSSVTAYQVASGTSCAASETRTCSNGVLSGSYTFSSCSVTTTTSPQASCSFNGATILSGASVTAYSTDLAPYGTTCAAFSEVRTCTNGVLSGSNTYSSCVRETSGGGCGGRAFAAALASACGPIP